MMIIIEWIALLITIWNRKMDYILPVPFLFFLQEDSYPIMKGDSDSAQDVFFHNIANEQHHDKKLTWM